MPQPSRPYRLGTRASPLALAQAELVQAALCAAHGWNEDAVEIVALTASGDRILDRPLADAGGKALWTKELDALLAGGEIDFSVHSMKDVETVRPDGFAIAAMLPRGDVRDRLIGADSIAALPQGARLGTSSPRRTAQLLHLRPDLTVVLFRGNVATRLRKLAEGEADATLLAAAGLDRLGLDDTGHAVDPAEMLPAPAQGAIGIEARTDDDAVRALLAPINHVATFAAVMAERAFLGALVADCRSPVAAQAKLSGDMITLDGQILTEHGLEQVRQSMTFPADDVNAPAQLADALLAVASPELRALFGR